MSKHTPGPWIVVSRGMFSPKVVDANGLGICHTPYAGAPPAEANAHLIAAAPDLLEALRSIADCCDEEHAARDYASRQAEIRGIARVAIAKATGEQP